ncbi:MAG: chitobiase/beta-hexosaminidase C-terminal domain-containing protein, partial [Syntrophomonas sp.]|nr:chitobiase/beta-hexosaminidase C-terminal domain-containing protein [Syntrophomonas sp.]
MKDQLECTRALERIKHINAEDTRTRLALAGFKSILGILVFVLLLLPGFSQVQPETVGQTVYSVSGYGFDIMGNMPNVSSITITSPGEAANWAQRTNQTISWDYTDNPGQTVKIELMQNGSAITTIPDSTANVSMGSNGSGSYTCQVPAVSVGNYKIRVTSVESSVYSATSPEFTITNPLAIIAPMASNAWCIGTTNNITWTYGDADIGSAVKLELLKNSSLVGDPIITSTQAGSNGTGSYAWTLPLTLEPGIDYQIRASSVDYPTIIATSANFTVTGNYTCSGNTLLGYNGPVSSLNSQGGNTGAVVVPIALGQTINGNIDKSDYFYPEAGGGIWQDEYQLVLHQDTEIALELHAPNGGYTRTLLYCDHASLPNGDKGTYSAFSGGDWVGNNTYRRPKAGFGDLSLGSNVYFPGLYRIVVFSDTPGPYTLKVLSPVAGTHINFTVENGNANAPQPVISDSNGHWTRDFDPASTYRITAEKTGYSVSPSSQVFDDPSDELDFELFSLASIPEIINLTLDKNMGVAGEIQTVNATIHATGAVDGTPVSICLLNTQGSNPLAPLFYPSPGDLDNKDLKKFWENLKEDPYQEITYKSIAANGTIINGQATVTMVIPDKLAPGYYQVRAQLAGSAGIMSTNYNISTATDVPSISSISLTPAQHNAGQSQYVDVSVETYNVTNGTSVTATLVNNDGSPLATPVGSVTGVISDNQVQLGLYLPSGVPAGHYSVKVTISLAEILTGFKPYHIVNYPDADAVDAAIEALIWEIIKGGNTTPDNITTNLKSPLPTTEPNGTSISWSADPVDWINTTTGAVTRPTTGQGHQTVVLTATISKGMFSGIKNFTLTIIDPAMVVTPSASLASGTYGGTQNITLSTATEGATIYYTTDNSKPTTASTPYTNMIEVASNMIIKAIAVKEGMENSPVSTFEYVIFAGGDGSIANPYQVATA